MSLDKIYFKNSDNLNIVGLLDQQDSKLEHVVLILHGSGGHKESSSATDIWNELAKRGISTLRIDQNGAGESDGKYEDQTIYGTFKDADAAINFLKKAGYNKISLYGASRGGTTALQTAIDHPELFRLGVKSPVSDYIEAHTLTYGQEFMDELKNKGCMIRTKKGKDLIVKQTFYDDAKKYIMYDKIKSLFVPTFIVHGSEDNQVPLAQSVRLVPNIPNGHLYVLQGANHDGEIEKDRSKCMAMLGDWFEKGVVPQ